MTYPQIANTLGFELCGDGCKRPEYNHAKGTLRGSTLHWTDRRVTKPGLRRFIMLAASHDIYGKNPRWWIIWQRNVWTTQAAAKLKVRLPARYADNDRAKVAWELRAAHTDPTSIQAAALRWAGRRHR